ncbi:hypothetical protein BCR34DRAFT_562128 [Clohesyomyces aquaticus]|uniref:Uncharacterized protein n=1 Tax=Clohesyomyces aquaticus TaxID=1231657 RepID=A0A1Y1ZT28_9PLEO|nr:hypothetical protein BCR34DRAFT_562128 [Clohesyomyces aquaticus]
MYSPVARNLSPVRWAIEEHNLYIEAALDDAWQILFMSILDKRRAMHPQIGMAGKYGVKFVSFLSFTEPRLDGPRFDVSIVPTALIVVCKRVQKFNKCELAVDERPGLFVHLLARPEKTYSWDRLRHELHRSSGHGDSLYDRLDVHRAFP